MTLLYVHVRNRPLTITLQLIGGMKIGEKKKEKNKLMMRFKKNCEINHEIKTIWKE